ncbi:MAG: zinc ABC transporter substrate-binding protein [Candidatus Thermoplasmatota archaeon]|nr:zinc ABC transporter substrate-binding protein [Candidatus Thermoplasmatota archaeon]
MSNEHTVILIAFALFIPAMVISGCLGDDDGSEGLDLVIVSILPQKNMIEMIAGEDVNVIVMIPEGQSPHDHSPTPGQLIDVARADMYFKIGSGLEFEELHMDTLIEQNRGMKIIDLSEGIELKTFDEHHGFDEHRGHSSIDTHIWLSTANLAIMAENVRDALIKEDPDGNYSQGYQDYMDLLNPKIEEITTILKPYRDREFLTYHPSWGYFADDLDLIQLAIEEDGKAPGPQGVAGMIEQAKDHNITVIFVEPQFDTSSAEEIADAIGGRVVMVDPLAEDMESNLLEVARAMVDGFNCCEVDP